MPNDQSDPQMVDTAAVRAALATSRRAGRLLADIEDTHNVMILYAAESGSRAWGFATPDSDYDVRFVYVRPLEWYMRVLPSPPRDVIEKKVVDADGAVFDIAGWDLRKALTLVGRGNVTLHEWMASPTTYWAWVPYPGLMRDAVRKSFSPRAYVGHYLGVAKGSYAHRIQPSLPRTAKKYLYALRAILCCRWIAAHGGPPPISLLELVKDQLPDGVGVNVDGSEPLLSNTALLDTFIAGEIVKFIYILRGDSLPDVKPDWGMLSSVFLDAVDGVWSR